MDVTAKLQTALDELDKTPPDNQAAITQIEGAIGDVETAVNGGFNPMQASSHMDRLAEMGRQLAVIAIDQAIAQRDDPAKTDLAQQFLADGDALRAAGAFKDAVNKYKDALATAEDTTPEHQV